MNLEQYNYVRPGLIRFWAWLDLLFGLALALPPLAYGFAKLIFMLNHLIGGTADLPVFAPVQWLMVFISGVFILNWAAARLLFPIGLLALIDGYLKLWLCSLLIYVIVALGAPAIFWSFVFSGVFAAVTQLAAVILQRPNKSASE